MAMIFTNMNRGEIWLVQLNPSVGSEIGKIRPVAIVSNNSIGILPLKVVIPITDWKERYATRTWMVKLETTSGNGLSKTSAADTFQVRSLSQERCVQRLGQLEEKSMEDIRQALIIVLDIFP
jgi:mRNA interferase MazF